MDLSSGSLYFFAWLVLFFILLRYKISLGVSILIISFGLSFSLGHNYSDLLTDAWAVTTDPKVLEILGVVTLIYLLSFLLKVTHRMELIAEVLWRKIGDNRWVAIAVPTMVGFLPMPGGAMFTAPITDEVGNRLQLLPEEKVFSNYWFRHCLEFAIPLYPGIILTAGLLNIPVSRLVYSYLPLAVVAFVSGISLFFYRLRVGSSLQPEILKNLTLGSFEPSSTTKDSQEQSSLNKEAPSVMVLWPIVALFVLALLQVPITVGLFCIVIAFAYAEKVSFADFFTFFRKSFNFQVLLLIWAVFLFGQGLKSTGFLVVIGKSLTNAGLPLWVLSCALPFLIGMMTGVTTGFVGTVFPVLIPLWGNNVFPWVQFAYSSGLAGVFLSPAHLCLSMTQDYFKADLKKVIFLIFFPVLILLIFSGFQLWIGLQTN